MATTKNRKKLTRKERELARKVATEPHKTNREIYREVYDTKTTNNGTVDAEVSRTINKPHIKQAIEKYSNLVENTLVNTVIDYKDSEDIRQRTLAVDTSKYLYDHLKGKATQKIQSVSTVVAINLDLTGVGLENKEQPTEVTEVDPTPH